MEEIIFFSLFCIVIPVLFDVEAQLDCCKVFCRLGLLFEGVNFIFNGFRSLTVSHAYEMFTY